MAEKFDACGKRIKANTAMILVNTATTTQRWHLACRPLGREPASEAASKDTKAMAA